MSPKCQNNVTRNLKMSQYMSRRQKNWEKSPRCVKKMSEESVACKNVFCLLIVQRGYGTDNAYASAVSAKTTSQMGTVACTPAGWDSSRSLIFFVREIAEHPDGEWTCNEPQNGSRAIKITTARKHIELRQHDGYFLTATTTSTWA